MALTNQIRYVFAADTEASNGAGKTGILPIDITAAYVVHGGTFVSLTAETITTLGTYQAPSSNAHFRIREISSVPTEGIYEVHFHNDQLATGSKLWLFLQADGAKFQPLEVSLTNDVSHIGGTAQTGRDIGASVLLSSGTGPGQVSLVAGKLTADIESVLGSVLTEPNSGDLANAFSTFFADAGFTTGSSVSIVTLDGMVTRSYYATLNGGG